MISKIKIREIIHLEKEIYKQLYYLNFRSLGFMQRTLTVLKRTPNTFVCYIIDEGNRVVGWLLLAGVINEWSGIFVYVRKAYRKRGLGKQLVRVGVSLAQKKYKVDSYYCPHQDHPSNMFFDNCEKEKVINNKFIDFLAKFL